MKKILIVILLFTSIFAKAQTPTYVKVGVTLYQIIDGDSIPIKEGSHLYSAAYSKLYGSIPDAVETNLPSIVYNPLTKKIYKQNASGSGFVTLTTPQTITGSKTFANGLDVNIPVIDPSVQVNNYINMHVDASGNYQLFDFSSKNSPNSDNLYSSKIKANANQGIELFYGANGSSYDAKIKLFNGISLDGKVMFNSVGGTEGQVPVANINGVPVWTTIPKDVDTLFNLDPSDPFYFVYDSLLNTDTLRIRIADGTQGGYLISSDWNMFNNKASVASVAAKENSLSNPSTNGYVLSSTTGGIRSWIPQASGGTGTVTNVSVTSSSGINSSVSNPTTTPTINLSLGAITPTSIVTGATEATTLKLTTGAAINYILASDALGNASWISRTRVTTIASSATPTPAADISDMFTVTALAISATFGAPTGTVIDGQSLLIRIKDNGAARALNFNAIYRTGIDFALPTTTVISKTIYLQFVYNAADVKWDAVGLTQGF